MIGVHQLLDDVAVRLRDVVALMAERAVILDGLLVATAPEVAGGSKITSPP